MANSVFKNRRNYLITGVVAVFAFFALWLRLIPFFSMGNTDITSMVAMDDPFYNLRQVELILAHFPSYGWFDPMTYYPYGTAIYWGPLFPTIIAFGCLITGAVTRPEIIGTALLVTPLFAAAIVVLMYFVGKIFGDWKTGLLASGFTAVISGQFFTISMYGYIDHHIAEVFFSTVFCLLYSYALLSAKDATIDFKHIQSYKKILLLAFIAGIGYLLGLFVMPTMILFALIVGVFTIVQFIVDAYRGRPGEYLVIINVTVFATAILGLLLFGLKDPGISLSTYSIGHIYAYLGLIGGTAALYLLSRYLAGKKRGYYPGVLAGCAVLFAAILFVAAPQIYNLLISSLFAFFGQQPVTQTVLEAMGWSLEKAWSSFNYGLLLFAGGALVLAWNNYKEVRPHQVFVLVWAAVMFVSTWQHIRYEYYLAVNIALISAVFVGFAADRAWPAIRKTIPGIPDNPRSTEPQNNSAGISPREKQQKKPKKKTGHTRSRDYPVIVLFILVALGGILFAYTSAAENYTGISGAGVQVIPDWKESLEWLGNNTPDTGVPYLGWYDQKTFEYPAQSYGVMSWWDYGHMITYIAKRIPNANPFQQGVAGPNGSAAFFVATSENTADAILDNDGTRYVVTDILMDNGKFPAMATWYNSSLAESPYMKMMLIPRQDTTGRYESGYLYTQDYYLTMVSRLHNFDGSMTNTTGCYYIEYADRDVTNVSLPAITNAVSMNTSAARERAREYNLNAEKGNHAAVLGTSVVQPVDEVPALRHYRLIHESPTNAFNSAVVDVKYVKVFEYVKGAHIKGTGIIELPLVTNTGRTFTYRQESVSGEFVVPYATTDITDGVTATGKYRISGFGREFEVPESAVMQGLTIK